MIEFEFNDVLLSVCRRYPWDISFDDFIGDYNEDARYSIDGRRDFDYDWIWESAEDDSQMSDILAESSDGYYVKRIRESDELTIVLFDDEHNPCGFYTGVESWVDLKHRGMDLSSMMISVSAILSHGSPNNGKAYGFSPSGVRAHEKAHEFLVNFAHENGFSILDENLVLYSLNRNSAYLK